MAPVVKELMFREVEDIPVRRDRWTTRSPQYSGAAQRYAPTWGWCSPCWRCPGRSPWRARARGVWGAGTGAVCGVLWTRRAALPGSSSSTPYPSAETWNNTSYKIKLIIFMMLYESSCGASYVFSTIYNNAIESVLKSQFYPPMHGSSVKWTCVYIEYLFIHPGVPLHMFH